MFVRPTNQISHRLARLAFVAACAAALTVAAAGPLHRYVGLDIEWAIAVFRYGFYTAVAAVALGLATILPTRPGDRRRGFVAAFLAVVIGIAGAWVPVSWFLWSQRLPMINDISTDIADPPAMVALLQLRRGAPNPPGYPGVATAVLQRAAYPDIVPVVLAVPPAEAFKRVDRVATALEWDVVARAPAEGRLEAVQTSDWFGFRDDIVVRIRPDGAGDVTDTHVAWRLTKGAPIVPALLAVGDELYGVNDAGVATCWEAKTGRVHWQERLDGNYSAAPLVAGGRIYFQNETGLGTVVEAKPVFAKLAVNDLGERTIAAAAAADGSLFVRTEKNLYRIASPAPAP